MIIIAKIKNDKYYTGSKLAEYIVNKTKEIIGEENIFEYLEPSAGGSVFLDYLDKRYLAYDIEPEDNRVVKQNFLELNVNYKEGRCIIGNPPFGDRKNNLVKKFCNKCIELGDYVAFILPISQLNNTQQMYEFDLVYSEDLGEQFYTDRELHCCFNIYKRPVNGKLNRKPNYKLKDIEIIEYRRGGNINIPNGYDYCMGTFGSGCVGRQNKYIGQYALEYYFYIADSLYKNRIIDILQNTNWKELSKGLSNTYRLPQWKIYKYIKEQIPEIQ